jgi:MFS family permease
MFGRILATLLAAILPPLTMALASLAMTLSASILLVFVEHTSAIGLYIGSGLVGMALSWQFGSVYSWTAMKLDITGRLASLFSGGCAIGGIVLVPLVNYIMAASGNDAAMIWTILTLVLVQVNCHKIFL